MNTRGNQQVGNESRHAVVLGGSLAGLLAARILADHFDEVTVIERDAYTETTAARKGVPQANHVHGLLVRGRQILEELFPGVQDEMIAAGAPVVDIANEIAWFTPAGWGVRFPSELMVLAFTRPLLDLHVRRRLAKNPRVRLLDNTDVVRLIPDSKTNQLAGVLICPRGSETDRRVAKELRADLIVDATGRASRAPSWLKDLGYEPPEEIVIDAHLAYASRLYRIPENFDGDWHCAYVQAAPPDEKRGAILFKVEDSRWLVTLIGRAGNTPPSDEAGFLEFARSLRVSTIFDAIRNAEPVTPIKTHRATQNRLRRYERAKRLPDNFLLLGDAVCAFNPVYGQGMTTAALGVMTLRQCLREGKMKGLSQRFQKRLAKVNAAPWMLAIGEDYRYRETVGGSPTLMTRFMHRYMDHVIQLATHSVPVRKVLLDAFNMLLPPSALFRPKVLFRVLLNVVNKHFVLKGQSHENANRDHGRNRQVGSSQTA
jgi:2-polyprenyl-6-methoxyphenol hydroxylase-like FAD-dependent oxidoreductase